MSNFDAVVDGGQSCEQRVASARDAATCPAVNCDFARQFTLEIGTGRDGTLDNYRSIEHMGQLYLVPGEQGLQHLLVAFRGSGFGSGQDPNLPLVEVRVLRACNEVGYVRFRLPWRADPLNASQLALESIRVVVADDLNRFEYCSILGQSVTLVVDATTPTGSRLHRELDVTVLDIDPSARPDIQAAWRRPCAGPDAGVDGGALDAAARDAQDGSYDASDSP